MNELAVAFAPQALGLPCAPCAQRHPLLSTTASWSGPALPGSARSWRTPAPWQRRAAAVVVVAMATQPSEGELRGVGVGNNSSSGSDSSSTSSSSSSSSSSSRTDGTSAGSTSSQKSGGKRRRFDPKNPPPPPPKFKLDPEEVFFEGPPSWTELVVPTLSILTVVGIIPFAAAVARYAWVRYKITSRRISVDSGFQGKDHIEIVYRDIASLKYVRRIGGSADCVFSLKDGAKLELRALPDFDKLYQYILTKLDDDAKADSGTA